MIEKRSFGTLSTGETITAYTLENDFISVTILDWGATIANFVVKSWQTDIVLGYDSLEEYLQGEAYFGASVGRVANRIAKGQYNWQGKTYQLEVNNAPNHLHSGREGLSFKRWQGQIVDNSLVFTTKINSFEDGFPGEADIKLTVMLHDAALCLSYSYQTMEDSFVNITNHSYFNLAGRGDIQEHFVSLGAAYYTPFDDTQIPRGTIEPVQETALDLRQETLIGDKLKTFEEELSVYRGYDHHYVLTFPPAYGMEGSAGGDGYEVVDRIDSSAVDTFAGEDKPLHLCGSFSYEDRKLSVYSNAPGFQFYTGNWIPLGRGRNNCTYGPHSGMCIEPQFTPNDINMPTFKESLTKAGNVYTRTIVYGVK